MLITSLLTVLAAASAASLHDPHLVKRSSPGPSFDKIDRFFVFGDSYSATGFQLDGVQPSSSNPLGNTDQYLHVWTRLICTAYGKNIPTYNLAYAGATVNSSVIVPYSPRVIDFEGQVESEFVPNYAGSKQTWNADSTLFIVWFGQNDVRLAADPIRANGMAGVAEADRKLRESYDDYHHLIGRLYDNGARNFLLLGVSAIETVPLLRNVDPIVTQWLVNARQTALSLLRNSVDEHLRTHGDSTARVYDPAVDQIALINDPARQKSLGIIDSTDYCPEYTSGSDCPYPIEAYLWYDNLHFGPVMNKIWADSIHALLSGA